MEPSHPTTAWSPRVGDETHASDELHREKTPLVVDKQFVEAHEIRVSDIGKASELPLQTIDSGGAGSKQSLQCDDLVAESVVHFIDHAHSARTQPLQYTKARSVEEVLFDRPL